MSNIKKKDNVTVQKKNAKKMSADEEVKTEESDSRIAQMNSFEKVKLDIEIHAKCNVYKVSCPRRKNYPAKKRMFPLGNHANSKD